MFDSDCSLLALLAAAPAWADAFLSRTLSRVKTPCARFVAQAPLVVTAIDRLVALPGICPGLSMS